MIKKKTLLGAISEFATLPFVIIMVIILIKPISQYDTKNSEIDKINIESTVEKYIIQCYATEGSYPPDLDYLVENYGLILDEEKYIYNYEIFASNVMPYIQVLDNNDDLSEQ